VTAVEYNPDIAAVYQDFYPQDTVIVGDAHEYLLKHYKDFDFIWASPPCQSHSDIRKAHVIAGNHEAVYPDMKLYQEIIFLKYYALKKTKWVVENVVPFYNYLIRPNMVLDRHPFWSNFKIPGCEFKKKEIINQIHDNSTVFGVSLKDREMPTVKYKKQILRNMVNPDVGEYIFNCMRNKEMQIEGGLF